MENYFCLTIYFIIDGEWNFGVSCAGLAATAPTINTKGLVIIMISKKVTVTNQVGLHARPATFFIQKANEFKASIWVEKEERRVNAKSLLGILSMGIVKDTEITIIADGSDEQLAVDELANMVTNGFTD